MRVADDGKVIRVRVTAHVRGGDATVVEVDVPVRLCDPGELLPALRGIDDALVHRARREAEDSGRIVTCREGCGACCRQLVPLTVLEARHIAAWVESLRDDRRVPLQSRFSAAFRRLAEAEILHDVMAAAGFAREPLRVLAARYFRLGIACPFLEEERCSIYAERPLACREYLVTSASSGCETLTGVDRVAVPGRLSPRLRLAGQTGWVPLVLALVWVADHPEVRTAPARMSGPELLADALGTCVASGLGGRCLAGTGLDATDGSSAAKAIRPAAGQSGC